MAKLVEFDLSKTPGGETSNSLIMLIQDIETIMVSKLYDIIADKTIVVDLEQYLFKYGVPTTTLSKQIRLMLNSGCTNTENYLIDVACEMLSTKAKNDMLYVQISVTGTSIEQQILEYTISNNLSVLPVNGLTTLENLDSVVY